LNSSEIIINYKEYQNIYSEVIDTQKKWLINKNRKELLLDEEIIRKHLRLLDLQEEKMNIMR